MESRCGEVAPRGTLVLKSTFHGSGRVDPRPLISRVSALKDAPEAIRYAQRPGVLKVLLQ